MLKQLASLVLTGLLMQATLVVPTPASDMTDKQARRAEKMKAEISRLGVGADARVEVKLKDKTKLRGYIREAGTDDFVVVNTKSGDAVTVPYPQVSQAKGNNLSTGAKIAVGLGIAAGVLIFIALLVDD